MILTCYVIGTGSLANKCLRRLIEHPNYQVLGVVSPDYSLKTLVKGLGVPYLNSISDITSKCDVLWSVVNPNVLPDSVLQLSRLGAINYHDALLPRYAGVHATSFALLNQETVHGVSWHLMTDRLDAGDVLGQVEVAIEPKETALSLNLKCYDVAFPLFERLLNELVEGTYTRTPQDLRQRTYYGYADGLPHGGIINWSDSSETIDRYWRAAYLGDQYINRFGRVQCEIGGEYYTWCDHERVTGSIFKGSSGTVMSIDKDSCVIKTGNGALRVRDFVNAQGQKVSVGTLMKRADICPGTRLSVLNEKECARLDTEIRKVRINESFWIRQFLAAEPGTTHLSGVKKAIADKPWVADKTDAKEMDSERFLLALLIYLYRIQLEPGAFYVGLEATVPESDRQSALYSPYVPLRVSFNDAMTVIEAKRHVHRLCSSASAHGPYFKNLSSRYPGLRDDISVWITQGNPPERAVWPPGLELIVQLGNTPRMLFAQTGVEQFYFDQFVKGVYHVFERIKTDDTQALGAIELVDTSTKRQLIEKWGGGYPNETHPFTQSIVQLFEAQVIARPSAQALVSEHHVLTYLELSQRTDRIAQVLGERTGQPIALIMPRCVESVMAMVGILKAGGHYLPIDPAYPDAMMMDVLKECAVKTIIAVNTTAKRCRTLAASVNAQVMVLDVELSHLPQQQAHASWRSASTTPNDLAYINYTSGSTGKPKGIQIRQAGVIRLVCQTEPFQFDASNAVAHISHLAFDATTFEVWGTLLTGGRLVVIDKDTVLDAKQLEKAFKRFGVTLAFMTVALLERIVRTQIEVFSGLRVLVFGGEAIKIHHLNHLQAHVRSARWNLSLVNGYGPTEGTTFSLYHHVDASVQSGLPIGRPLKYSQAFVLDAQKRLLPPGVPGELYLSGVGLAQGYINRSTLNHQRFVAAPFKGYEQYRLYKTGDRVRWNGEGQLEFLGRMDNQVKLRGLRIELDALQQALMNMPTVSDVAVAIREVGGTKKKLYWPGLSSGTTLRKAA